MSPDQHKEEDAKIAARLARSHGRQAAVRP